MGVRRREGPGNSGPPFHRQSSGPRAPRRQGRLCRCNASRKDLIAHGIGHALGLNDVLSSSCNGTIMGRPIPGQEMAMVSEVCSMINSRWLLTNEMGGGSGDDPFDDDPGTELDCGQSAGCGSPIVIDMEGDNFRLTSLEDGVLFDLDHDGWPDWMSWTAQTTDDAFLVLDRNENGLVDGGQELFGNYTPQPPVEAPKGFLALAVFDQPSEGGDGDGFITSFDAVFAELQLWRDQNHDGFSQPDELTPLVSTEITAIDLDYIESSRRDRHGNLLRWASKVYFGSQPRLSAIDVLFLMAP